MPDIICSPHTHNEGRNLKNKNNKDVCLVDVIIPDLPGSMEEASRCNAYAGDIAR